MPPFLQQLGEFGLLASVMGCIIWLMYMLIKKFPNKSESEVSKALREISTSLIAHNERATVNQELMLKNFAIVLHDHEKMIDSISKVIMAITVQDKVMDRFQTDIADIKCTLSQISKKQYEMPHG